MWVIGKLMRLGLGIESSSSNRVWNPNSIVDFSPIWNPTTNPNQQSRFRYKIDLFQSKFDLVRLKDQYQDKKVWLKDRKNQLKDRKSWFIYQKQQRKRQKPFIFDQFWLNSTNFWYKSNSDSKSESEFESSRRFRWISATILDH